MSDYAVPPERYYTQAEVDKLTAQLQARIDAAMVEIADLRRQGDASHISIHALYKGWADRMEAAIAPKPSEAQPAKEGK
jgi:hypothetical protein